MQQVYMSHPDLDVVIQVAESAAPIHMASGWQLVEGEKAEQVAQKKLAADETAALAPPETEASDTTAKSRRSSASKE